MTNGKPKRASRGQLLRIIRRHVGESLDAIVRDAEFLDFLKSRTYRDGECLIWATAKTSAGYGTIRIRGVIYGAHRISHLIHNGPLSPSEFVCHRCDRPSCIEPSHLFAGSPADNSRDMSSKGRSCRGRRNPQSKLTEDDVREIRRLKATGRRTDDLAKMFGVCVSGIGHALSGRNWKHVV